ncbi:C40 family peptidase [Ornithinimicrobium cerasi]|uniref:C40 family peptidase n=1 Tax=Ornithinimicrobium cerasi TaxID=2248773 RepID=UPI00137B8549|nr:NlpC/P60 family protein [Ornithinimicrobium cerasi]
MTTRTRSFSRTLVAAAAATAPVMALAPAAQAAPAPAPVPRTPLTPATPVLPAIEVPAAPFTMLPTLPTVETTVTRVVSVPVANVRSGPSTAHGVVGTRTSGTTVRGVISTNGWLKISAAEFMAPSVLSTPASTGTVTQYVTAAVGNVRSGPGLGYGVVGTKTRGTEVRGSWVDGWLSLGSGQFISSTILSSTDPDGGSGGGGSDVGGTSVTRWVTTAANVRSGPSTSYSVVGSRQAGAQVSGPLSSNGWLRIADGQFMSPGVLTTTAPGGAPGGGGEATTVKRWVSAAVANVRSGPSTSYGVVGTRVAGTEVSGTVSTNGWLQMSASQWMAPTVLTSTPPASSPAPAPTPPPTVTPPPSGTSPLRQAVLETASRYVGYPYVLYGTPPNAFDCSSYTWWVYQQNGVNIPRTVRDQKAMVTRVTDPQPGDLVFYDDFYHVSLYAGDGKVYEALNPTAGVRYGDPVTTRIWFGRLPGM